MLFLAGDKPDLAKNSALRWMRGHLALTAGFEGERFWVWRNGVRTFAPLFLVIVMITVTDIVLAVDSIPANFAFTEDPFIVMTANIFAVLGLQADMADRFHLLSYGLAVVQIFIGAKMLLLDVYKIPVFLALRVVVVTIAASVAAGLIWRRGPPT